MGALPTDYTFLAEDLAGFGYIVAGIAPTRSSRVVVFPDGRVVWGSESVDLEHRERAQPIVDRWLADCGQTLDYLVGEGQVDARRIGIFGHSLAGAMQAVVSGIPSAAWRQPGCKEHSPSLPASRFCSSTARRQILNDRILADLQSYCHSDRAGCRREDFPDAGHVNFSDAGLMPLWFPVPKSRLGITGIDSLGFLQLVARRLRAFFVPLSASGDGSSIFVTP